MEGRLVKQKSRRGKRHGKVEARAETRQVDHNGAVLFKSPTQQAPKRPVPAGTLGRGASQLSNSSEDLEKMAAVTPNAKPYTNGTAAKTRGLEHMQREEVV